VFTSASYPVGYGFIENTLAEDGDPLDALVILEEPAYPLPGDRDVPDAGRDEPR
jgi:inorganic pyrophosphatase